MDQVIGLLLDFFFPPRCGGCRVYLGSGGRRHLCERCFALIDRIKEPFCDKCGAPFHDIKNENRICVRCAEFPPAFGRARSIARYEAAAESPANVLGAILRRHKYGLDQSAWRALAACIGNDMPLGDNRYDLIIPVPLHRRRLRWRGFNQAALFAAVIARRTGARLDMKSLMRSRETPPQTTRDPQARRRNVRNAFHVTNPSHIQSRNILLVDDVFTTGATASECARTLLSAGALCVDVLTLARAA